MQLDLFSQENMQLSKAFEMVRSLQFAEALQCYKAILRQNPDQPQALEGSHLAAKWNSVWRQCGHFNREDDVHLVYQELLESEATWGISPSFKMAVLQKLTAEMERLNMHFLEEGLSLGDLWMEIEEPDRAEVEYERYLKEQPHHAYWHMQLANSQYIQHKQRPPAVHYTLALLYGLSANDYPRIQHPGLRNYLTEHKPKHPAAMVWIMGFLPLLRPNELNPHPASDKEKPSEEIALYQLLITAENQRKGNSRQMLAARKKLKEANAEVFEAYLKKLERR